MGGHGKLSMNTSKPYQWFIASVMLFHCLHCITSFSFLRGIPKQGLDVIF